MSNNTVDTSPERIAQEWAIVRQEALKIQPATPEQGESETAYSTGEERPEVGMGAGGFEVPDIPTGQLCCFVGAIAADAYAPNWRANGLTNEMVESIGRPAGLVIDKYLDKYFPGQKLGELLEPWKEELALGFAVVNVYAMFKNVPRRIDNTAPQEQPQHQEPQQASEEAA
ncbi:MULTISPECIES: hypothetical protein [unclassified Halobacteriovorax]|uniref:hypothetical protein n=1 Tax=unclassified Halobacteriovorax TaxID=2639665 RepID=UPI00399C0293